MTSQDALIAYFVETSGITSPTQVAELLGVPSETARKWMRRYRTMRADPTGQISPVGDIDRSNSPKPVKSDRSDQPAPRARTSYPEKKPPIVPQTDEPLLVAPTGADCDLDARFAEWWDAFPRRRRQARDKCRKKFRDVVRGKNAPDAEHLIQALREFRGFGSDPEYDVNPLRWLNEQRWEAEPQPKRQAKRSRPEPSSPSLEELFPGPGEVVHAH